MTDFLNIIGKMKQVTCKHIYACFDINFYVFIPRSYLCYRPEWGSFQKLACVHPHSQQNIHTPAFSWVVCGNLQLYLTLGEDENRKEGKLAQKYLSCVSPLHTDKDLFAWKTSGKTLHSQSVSNSFTKNAWEFSIWILLYFWDISSDFGKHLRGEQK